MSNGWGEHVPFDEACRRAGGRRLYNQWRQFKAELRRGQVVELLGVYGLGYGAQARVARQLGVSRSIVCRDVRALWALRWGENFVPYHLKGWTVAQIARAYSLPQSTVRYALDDALGSRCRRMRLGSDPPTPYADIAGELAVSVPDARRYVRKYTAKVLAQYRRPDEAANCQTQRPAEETT